MINFLRTLILLGSIQGFITCTLLFFARQNRYASRILAVLIFLISLAIFNLYASYKDWFGSGALRLAGEIIPFVVVMPIGPLIWFYTRSVPDPGFRIGKRERRHFYPVVIDLFPSLVVITAIACALTHIVRTDFSRWGVLIDTYNVYADIPRWLSLTIYLWISYRQVKQYTNADAAMTPRIKWLRSFVRGMLVFQCIWLAYLIPYVIPSLTDRVLDLVDWYPVYIPMAILVYWLGYKGLAMSMQQDTAQKKIPLSIPSDEVVTDTIDGLRKTMETDRLYLNPALNLKMVSDHSGIPQKTISAVLNQKMNLSFNEYVNRYRVNEFKKRVHEPGMDQFTIAGIAMECGFNSQATFQRSFKQETGMSPAVFRDETR